MPTSTKKECVARIKKMCYCTRHEFVESPVFLQAPKEQQAGTQPNNTKCWQSFNELLKSFVIVKVFLLKGHTALSVGDHLQMRFETDF